MRVISLPLWLPLNAKWRVTYDPVSDHCAFRSGVRVYANEGARTKIDELKKVKFSKRSNKAAQGDKSLTVDVDMMIVGGVYQDGVAPV